MNCSPKTTPACTWLLWISWEWTAELKPPHHVPDSSEFSWKWSAHQMSSLFQSSCDFQFPQTVHQGPLCMRNHAIFFIFFLLNSCYFHRNELLTKHHSSLYWTCELLTEDLFSVCSTFQLLIWTAHHGSLLYTWLSASLNCLPKTAFTGDRSSVYLIHPVSMQKVCSPKSSFIRDILLFLWMSF